LLTGVPFTNLAYAGLTSLSRSNPAWPYSMCRNKQSTKSLLPNRPVVRSPSESTGIS
jgi:hypothetical protein